MKEDKIEMGNSYSDFYANKLFAHGSTLLSGAILLFVGWGVKNLNFIDTSTTGNLIWSILNFALASYIMGFLISIFAHFMKSFFNIYQNMIYLSVFVFVFYAFFLSEYVSSEHRAANQYKRLIEKHIKTLNDDDERESLEYDIEEIEGDRNSWKESDDRDNE